MIKWLCQAVALAVAIIIGVCAIKLLLFVVGL